MTFQTITGVNGIGWQSGQGVQATNYTFVPVLSNNLEFNQQVNTLAPEVGGDYFRRGSYKAGVDGGGSMSLYPRGNSIGHLLYALCGTDTATVVTGTSNQAYQHVMAPYLPGSGIDLPRYTLIKGVSTLLTQQYLDSRLESLSVEVNKQQVVTTNCSWFATVPTEIAAPTGVTTDNSGIFTACTAAVSLLDESTGLAFSSTTNTSIDRISLEFRNELATDEFAVGSYYPIDSTLLQRSVNVQMDLIIRDKALWEAIYMDGGSTNWSPVIKRGHLNLVLTSAVNIGTSSQPYTLTFDFPGLDLKTMPLAVSGAQLLRSTITAELTLGPSASDRFTATLISGITNYAQ